MSAFIPLEFYAYAAATLGVAGTLMLARKRKSGWILSIFSTLLFIGYGWKTGIGSFVIVEFVSIFSSMYALDRWISASDAHKHQRRTHKK